LSPFFHQSGKKTSMIDEKNIEELYEHAYGADVRLMQAQISFILDGRYEEQ